MGEPIRFTTQQPQGRELVRFTVDGVGLVTDEPWEEEFRALPVVPFGALDALSAAVVVDKKGVEHYNQLSILAFFDAVLVDEDVDRFREMCNSKDKAVDIMTLFAVMKRLTPEVTEGVPTTPQSVSTNGGRLGAST